MVNAAGIGSGIDINGLVTQLIQAEGLPKAQLYDRQEATLQAKLSGFGTLKSALSDIRTSLLNLDADSDFDKRIATSSDNNFFTATADKDAVAGSYEIIVEQLAQNHKLATNNFTASSNTVGSGLLTISTADDSFAVQIDSDSNTLAGIRDAINAAENNDFVTATIVNVDDGVGGTETRLMLTANNAGDQLAIAADDDDGTDTNLAGLSQLAYQAGGTENLEEVQAMLPSKIHIDGQLVTTNSNTLEDAIDGVTINLADADIAETHTLSITKDNFSVTNAINGFITAYNGYVSTAKSLSQVESSNNVGVLVGDATLRGLGNQLRKELTTSFGTGFGVPKTLAELGITTGEDGSLVLDSAELETALENNPDVVSGFFADSGGFAERMNTLMDSYLNSGGLFATRIDGFEDGIDRINESRQRLELRLVAVERRLRAQFNAMDALVASLNATSGFLDQQLTGLSNLNAQISGN